MTTAPLPTRRPAAPPAPRKRPFVAGSSGWTVDDLADPHYAYRAEVDRLEILDGVLTKMAPAGIQGIGPTCGLRDFLYDVDKARGLGGRTFTEVDVLLKPDRMPRPDLVYLSAEQYARQKEIERFKDYEPLRHRPVFVMPLLVVETISRGHVGKDRVVRRAWYAEAGIRHYWILDPLGRSLDCLLLDGMEYRDEATGRGLDAVVHSSIFGGLDVPIAAVWDD